MSDKIDWYKQRRGETFEQQHRHETAEQAISRRLLGQKSNYELRKLGIGDESVLMTEEERATNHSIVLGTTREGKSRYLYGNIVRDIELGNGVLFIDPTDRGETAKLVLKWCCAKGFDKVLYIDPRRNFINKKIPVINPFLYDRQNKRYFPTHRSASVENALYTLQTVFNIKDVAQNAVIMQSLEALLFVLWSAGVPLYDSLYFTVPPFPQSKTGSSVDALYRHRRELILDKSHPNDRHQLLVLSGLTNQNVFDKTLGSSTRRLNPLFNEYIEKMFASLEGIDFTEIVSKGWVVLVNAYPALGFPELSNRLLGTALLQEVDFAIDRIREHNPAYNKKFYIYIDEAGRFVNRKMSDILAHKLKSGISMTLSHQYSDQVEDELVLKAIYHLCKIKVMFHTPDHGDRLHMMRQFYGGNIDPNDAAWVNSDIPKQHAIIKVNKQDPRKVKIPNYPDPTINGKPVDGSVLDSFIQKLYQNPWYKDLPEIEDEINERYKLAGQNTVRPQRATPPVNRAVGKVAKQAKKHSTGNAQPNANQGASNPQTPPQPPVAWTNLFVANQGKQKPGP